MKNISYSMCCQGNPRRVGAFFLVIITYKRAKEKVGFKGSPPTLSEKLSDLGLRFIQLPEIKDNFLPQRDEQDKSP